MTFTEELHPRDDHGRWTHGGGSGVYDKLTANDILAAVPAAPPGSRNNADIAKDLNARGQAALKELGVKSGMIETPGKGETADPKETNILSSAIASEIEAALRRDERSAENWYSSKMDEAMKIAQAMHPEMENNPSAKFGYTAALAITSQGETVPSNARLADQAYEIYEKSGKFPTNIESQAKSMMNNNFMKLNDLIKTMGVAGTREFLNKEFTVRDLEKMGYTVGGENKSAKVYGSAILGPKIGQGFYQNLNGNYKPLTADMWFMRSWGRITGTLTGTVPVEKPRQRFEDALRAEKQRVPYGKFGDLAGMENKANEIISAHEKDFRDNRADYDSGKKTKSELVLAAERLDAAINGIKDQPSSGGQRQHMRDVFAEAQEKLAAAGHKMSIADMQATWWYPEKNLYAKMGGRNSERINTDYATALRDMAVKKGVPSSVID